uniref:Calumenin a n=1 Tax=Scophthalmus maximus TaxID=52904 RepID=A0A8D3C1R8_SCOMX
RQPSDRSFRVADRNRDSSADKLQFTAFLYPESYEHMQDVVVQETIDDINKSGDGFIDLNEYIDVFRDNVKDPDWVETERQQFSELRDKDKDGKMDRQETMEWILPSDSIHAEFGAKHLLSEFDTN